MCVRAIDVELRPGGADEDVTIWNLDEYIAGVLDATLAGPLVYGTVAPNVAQKLNPLLRSGHLDASRGVALWL
jgi:hypothetical protein|eukprot:COSAG01_NODE_11102_length_2007_cov_646.801887_1_plen_73_part_00